jgi:hypothetical protein
MCAIRGSALLVSLDNPGERGGEPLIPPFPHFRDLGMKKRNEL